MSLFSGSPGSPSSPSRSISKGASTGGSFSVYQITEHTDNDTFWKDPRRAEKIDELKEQWARDTARAVAEAVDAKEAEMMARYNAQRIKDDEKAQKLFDDKMGLQQRT